MAGIEANTDGRMITCRNGGLQGEKRAAFVRARGSDRRSGLGLTNLIGQYFGQNFHTTVSRCAAILAKNTQIISVDAGF